MITAKLKCTGKAPSGQPTENPEDQTWMLSFGPDYADGANAEWAAATPSLSLSMTVKASVAEHYAVGESWDLAFTKPDGHADDADYTPADDAGVVEPTDEGDTAQGRGRGARKATQQD